MTQRDLPKVGPATTVEPPKVTASVGQWVQGLQDHITDDEKHRMMLAFGLTIDPDVLSVNGRQHVLEQLDNDEL